MMRIHDPSQFTRHRLERLLDRLAGALPQATAASLIGDAAIELLRAYSALAAMPP